MSNIKNRVSRIEDANPHSHVPVTLIDRVIIGSNGEREAVLRRELAEDGSGWTSRWLSDADKAG